MGRRKILINQITDPKLRNITFIKRRHGLIKKAAELSLLCNVNMLLIFEDGNGNLIQFSRNKITTIPSFFKECTYSSVSEFTSNDYPNFFNASHKRKRRGRKNGEQSNKEAVTTEEDGFPVLEDLPLLVPEVQSSQKGENITTAPASTYEGFMSPGMVSYSSSEEPSPEGRDEIYPSSDNQVRESYHNQSRSSRYMMNKPEDMGGHYPEESGICLNKRDPDQNHHKVSMPMRCPIIEDKPSDYIQPHIPSKRPVKRLSFREDRSHPYRNYPFEYNMPNYPDYHPSHYPYSYYYDPYPHRSLHFSHYMRPGAQTFREMSDEEAVDKMFRFTPKGLGMDPGDHKSERNEFTHISGNYVKNREKVANYVNPDCQQEVYHYQKGDYYSYGDNISSNLDYANSFESDSFNEFSDPKKKLKQ